MASQSEVDSASLVALTSDLIAIPSVSLDESAIADWVVARLSSSQDLDVIRIGDNVVARTPGDDQHRVLFAGHLDTVPPNGNAHPRIEGDRLYGLGSTDMKSGLAVMLALAQHTQKFAAPLTFVFYVAEEIDRKHNGLLQIDGERPDLLRASCAVLGEPTDNVVEAGCQGVVVAEIVMNGQRAHTARPWMGINAIQRAAGVLSLLDAYESRTPVVDGCEYREAMQAVRVSGGVANNVVPDSCTVTINHRFAPDRDADAAVDALTTYLAPVLGPDDELTIVQTAPAAHPGLSDGGLGRLVASSGYPPRAKLGWTDVAFFAERGVPACNFGPGDPLLAHTSDEHVVIGRLAESYEAIARWLRAI